jgi:hypothetical protein
MDGWLTGGECGVDWLVDADERSGGEVIGGELHWDLIEFVSDAVGE